MEKLKVDVKVTSNSNILELNDLNKLSCPSTMKAGIEEAIVSMKNNKTPAGSQVNE